MKQVKTLILLMISIFCVPAVNADHQVFNSYSEYLSSKKKPYKENINSKMLAGGRLGKTMRSVGITTSYGDRYQLVEFLAINGILMFPCEGGSNPYFNPSEKNCDSLAEHSDVDNVYIGTAGQNKALERFIRKNRHLFQNGDLTAKNAKKWRR